MTLFLWAYGLNIFMRLYFHDYSFIVLKFLHEIYLQGLYFRISMISQIYAKQKVSTKKGVLQYSCT